MGMSADTRDLDAALIAAPESRARGFALALEAEREQFFLWSPVCLGAGIAAYFAMPVEPQLIVAFVPLALALIFARRARAAPSHRRSWRL